MKCPSCGCPEVLVESKPNGDKHIACPKCGLNEVRDKEGRKLLLDTVGSSAVLLS